MNNYASFLDQFAKYAIEKSIRWAVVGSQALLVHAGRAGLGFSRTPGDLDLIAYLPRHLDAEFRTWLDRKSLWVYEKSGLGAIHFCCDDAKQVDIFPKPDTQEIDRSISGGVLGVTCLVVCQEDIQNALKIWAAAACDLKHAKYDQRQKYLDDVHWFENNFSMKRTVLSSPGT